MQFAVQQTTPESLCGSRRLQRVGEGEQAVCCPSDRSPPVLSSCCSMLFMAVTSTGSAELIGVSALFSYDIYR